jgi:UDP-N-acetylmuramoyl-tripeptide--D-alanyl-D-alanine ligase
MDEDEIIEAVKNIKSTERMIKTFIGKNGALIIDDSYSANPAGVLAALDYLAEQDKKYKIIIMPCLIELGEAAAEIHREIGKKIAEVCDLAIITTKDYFDIIKEEAGEKAILAVNSEKVIKILNDKLNEEAAVLLEGRLAQDIIMFARQ